MKEQLKIKYQAIRIKKDKEDYYVIISKNEEDFYLSKDEYYYSELHDKIFKCISEREYFEPDREFKIIYQSKQIHEGVPVIDMPFLENVNQIAREYYQMDNILFFTYDNIQRSHGFAKGYSAAKKKYQFTEEDIRKAFSAGRTYQMGEYSEYHGGREHNYPGENKYIQELIKSKSYSIEFETEWNGGRAGDSELILKLNSEGKPTIAKWMEI